jgi:hypothetical protein
MQKLAIKTRRALSIPIQRIPHYRMTQVAEMHPNLMSPTGVQLDLN